MKSSFNILALGQSSSVNIFRKKISGMIEYQGSRLKVCLLLLFSAIKTFMNLSTYLPIKLKHPLTSTEHGGKKLVS